MSNDGEERRYKGVRKRKWGKYVAEIRAGKRSRISLGSFFTAEAAARAYDTALMCLRGPNSSSFNFPESTALDVGSEQSNPSPVLIRTAAIRVGSQFDTVPAKYLNHVEARPSEDKEGSNIVEAGSREDKEASTYFGQALADNKEEDQNMSEMNIILHSPEEISIEERVQMSLPLPHERESMLTCDSSELFPDLWKFDENTLEMRQANLLRYTSKFNLYGCK